MKKLRFASIALLAAICFAAGMGVRVYAEGERDGVDFANDWNGRKDCVVFVDNIIENAPNTLEAWVKVPSDITGRVGSIFSNSIAGDPYFCTLAQMKMRTSFREVDFYIDANGHPVAMWYDGDYEGDTSVELVVDDVDVRTGQWTHLAFVRDVDKSMVRFYQDGVLKKSITSVGKQFTLTETFGIGGSHATVNKDFFHGEISDLRVWNTARSDSEISANYSRTVSPSSDGLEANWPLDEDGKTSRTFRDTTGKHNASKNNFWILDSEYTMPQSDYTFIVLPDTQCMARDNPLVQRSMTKWIVDNKDRLNVKFAMHLGDYGNGLGGRNTDAGMLEWLSEWNVARSCMKLLTDAGIEFSSSAGNHDYDERHGGHDTTYFNQYFPISYFKSFNSFGGAYEEDKSDNCYFTLDISGHKYLIIALEFGPRQGVIEWANEVIESHPEYQVIVTSHDGVMPGGEFSHKPYADAASFYSTVRDDCNDGLDIWNKLLSKHENVLMFINGHYSSEFVVYREDTGDNGNTVHSMLINGQNTDFETGGTGLIGILGFAENGNRINVNYYSPNHGYYGGMRSQFSFYVDPSKAETPAGDITGSTSSSTAEKKGCGGCNSSAGGAALFALLPAAVVAKKKFVG